MDDKLTIVETDVLITTIAFLVERGVTPYQFSVAVGKGIDTAEATGRLRNAFSIVGCAPHFSRAGADILGLSDSEWWAVECKGAGTGKPSTQRSNFDRALASVVSYYEDIPQGIEIENRNITACLGLALPDTNAYLKELRRRVRTPLRKRLNLWVLLYQQKLETIRAVPPDELI